MGSRFVFHPPKSNPPKPEKSYEPTDAEVVATIRGQHREMYFEKDAPASRSKTIFEFYRKRLIEAKKQEQEKLQSDLEWTGKVLDLVRRLQDDPTKAHLLPRADASPAELQKWYEEMSKPQGRPDYGNPPEEAHTLQSGEYPNGQVAHTRGWEPGDPIDTPSSKTLVNGIEQSPAETAPKVSEMDVPTPDKWLPASGKKFDGVFRDIPPDKPSNVPEILAPPLEGEPPETLADEPTQTEAEIYAERSLSKWARFLSAMRVVGDYLWQWTQLSIVVAAFLAFGFGAMSYGQYIFAEILYVIGVGLFIAKSIHELRTHELRKEIAIILIVLGILVLTVLVGWTELKRRNDNPKRNDLTVISAPPSETPFVAITPTANTHHRLINKTPRQLLGLYEGRTALEADRLMEPFKNEWIKITGKVSQVSLGVSGDILVYLDVIENKHTDEVAGSFNVANDPETEKLLRQLGIGDQVTLEGKIYKSQERTLLYLVECEYVQP